MSWSVVDIRATSNVSSQAVQHTPGSWKHASAEKIYVVNATTESFVVNQLPQLVVAKTFDDNETVRTTVHAGAKGVIDGVDARVPWSVRLSQAVNVCEETSEPCVAVIDAPPAHEIQGSINMLESISHRISQLCETNSLVILTGPEKASYPKQVSERLVVPSEEPWGALRGMTDWGCFVALTPAALASSDRLRSAFSLLLGYQTTAVNSLTSTACYPEGSTMPRVLFPYMRFSDNVVFGSARVSRTRGITAATNDGKPWSAKVILSGASYTESDEMKHLRILLTSDDLTEKGAAYFHLLANQDSLPDFARRALTTVHSSLARTDAMAAAPLMRAVSHSPCL